MNHKITVLEAGLYLVATPLGTARDITLRALDVLASADVLAAEDTRTLRKLCDIHAIPTKDRRIIAYHDHSNASDRAKILEALKQGKSVAYASEAGTPLIADPGYKLVQDAREHDQAVHTVPGPCAVVAALTLAGLPTDQFYFAGFLPNQSAARVAKLTELAQHKATLVFYESPNRITATLQDIANVTGPDRPVAICREITKKFEQTLTGTVAQVQALVAEKKPKGEIVLLIGPSTGDIISQDDIETALRNALLTKRTKDAVDSVAGAYNQPRRKIYQMALELKSNDPTENSDGAA